MFRFGEFVSRPPERRRAPPRTESFAPELAELMRSAGRELVVADPARVDGVESASGVDPAPAVARLRSSLEVEPVDVAGRREVDLEVDGVSGRMDLLLAAPALGVEALMEGIFDVLTLLVVNWNRD